MPQVQLSYLSHVPTSRQPMELVERKGLGHPDSMCDAMMEAISVDLCQAYIDASLFSAQNVEKVSTWCGQSLTIFQVM